MMAELYINEAYVTKTNMYKLEWPEYKVIFNEKFELHLCERPDDVTLKFKSTQSLFNTEIGSCKLNVPGEGALMMASANNLQKEFYFTNKEINNNTLKEHKPPQDEFIG